MKWSTKFSDFFEPLINNFCFWLFQRASYKGCSTPNYSSRFREFLSFCFFICDSHSIHDADERPSSPSHANTSALLCGIQRSVVIMEFWTVNNTSPIKPTNDSIQSLLQQLWCHWIDRHRNTLHGSNSRSRKHKYPIVYFKDVAPPTICRLFSNCVPAYVELPLLLLMHQHFQQSYRSRGPTFAV